MRDCTSVVDFPRRRRSFQSFLTNLRDCDVSYFMSNNFDLANNRSHRKLYGIPYFEPSQIAEAYSQVFEFRTLGLKIRKGGTAEKGFMYKVNIPKIFDSYYFNSSSHSS